VSAALPAGAKEIWTLRSSGMKPNEVVFVSAIGELNSGTFQVFIEAGDKVEQFDWRWAVDLSVCVVFGDSTPRKWLGELCKAILRAAPNGGYTKPFNRNFGYLWAWNADRQKGQFMTWWKGVDPIPLLDIEGLPESFESQRMGVIDTNIFAGVNRA
jgi:hypothetical protein